MKRTLLAAILLVGATLSARADFEAGAAAYVRGDWDEAFVQFRLLAANGDVVAQTLLGRLYDYGRGVPQDRAKAFDWASRAAEQGFAPAEHDLGIAFTYGYGVLEDNIEAMRHLHRAASGGHVNAQFELGRTFLNVLDAEARVATGTTDRIADGFRWLHAAASAGHGPAQRSLGRKYAGGYGVPQDSAEAAQWFRMGAEQGGWESQEELGRLYEEGRGVPQDYAEAVKWYRLSALAGDISARITLGNMYRAGKGVPLDLTEAYFWYRLAASNPFLKDDPAAEESNSVATHLTSAQRAIVRIRVEHWQGPPPTLRVQHLLRQIGYDPGAIDGVVGWRARAAIRSFQTDMSLPVTEEPSLELAQQLERASELRELVRLANRIQQTPSEPPLPHRSPRRAPPTAEAPQSTSTGSGFVLNRGGDVLTNRHVVDGCRTVRVAYSSGQTVAATRIRKDQEQDLAIVETTLSPTAHASFRSGRGIRLGEEVIAVGYPLYGLLAEHVSVTDGMVSNLAGIGGDRSLVQITTPVQPGNSGGPLLDRSGNVVGIVVGKLDAVAVADITGDIPQNVNFAVNAGIARLFLDLEGVEYDTAPSNRDLDAADIAARAREFTVLIECFE